MNRIKAILEELKKGKFSISIDDKIAINDAALNIMTYADEEFEKRKDLLDELVDIITIGNITYEHCDTDIIPLDNGVYDLLVEQLKRVAYDRYHPGAVPVVFNTQNQDFKPILDKDSEEMVKPFTVMSEDDRAKYADSFFPSILDMNKPFDPDAYIIKPFYTEYTAQNISKRLRNVAHNYPNLVGTLDKCKFVLDAQAKEVGAYEEDNVKILERDFFVPLLQKGIINMNTPFEIIGTLKYDGVSIEADVTDHIISARTRGDTDFDIASDLTPIFEGYKFPNAKPLDKPIGMKFEAIVLYEDLVRMNKIFGTNYINGRTAIIGILGSSDARKMRDFITLVPLQCDFGADIPAPTRIQEIEFLNTYYASKEYIRWVIIEGVYTNVLFQIKKYVEEAEYFRDWSKFMYDGVVLEFADPNIRQLLGRKNSINQYAMAVKFNPLKRITTFTGFTYTVGQNGAITPMIHYTPIEFLGSIHTKSTGSSYERFRNLNLFIGDQIEVTYVNDVMPYVTKPDIEYNRKNHCRDPRPEEEFPTTCPCCGATLVESSNGKTMYCPNMDCTERTMQRLSNMLDKLDIKDFSRSTIEQLNVQHLWQLMQMTPDDFSILGPTNSIKFYNELQKLKTNPLPDYRIIGALGFSNIAAKKWKIIFSKFSLKEIFHLYLAESAGSDLVSFPLATTKGLYDDLRDMIADIKGVGPITADTISAEMSFFENDINYIINNNMYVETPIGSGDAKYQIRFSGFRDATLVAVLNKFPDIDCDDNASVTKKTTLLLVPYMGFASSKVNKAMSFGIPVVTVKEFLEDPNKYIPGLIEIEF